jgi:hypothetical protein
MKKVTSKFLNDLADQIYDPKTGAFLRLCNGTLQNGPDLEDEQRPMHCGLGELYFAMTGVQPKETGVSEDEVVEEALEASTLVKLRRSEKEFKKQLKALGLDEDQIVSVIIELDDDVFFSKEEIKFREALHEIPTKNDDGTDEALCTPSTYKARSRRVANQLRKAAKLLP